MGRFLECVHIGKYGAFTDYDLGPLRPGLNVVYGPNEAGKSTIASFIGGVLFGWDEARGVGNTYRPSTGQRSGSLAFSDDASGERLVVSRARNEDGLQGDARIIADIDHATYRTMFSLTSDELRSLRNAPDVTARLITAGSGTGSSPVAALSEIERRIAVLASGPDGAGGSIGELVSAIDEKHAEVEAAQAANDLFKHEDLELSALLESRVVASEHLEGLNAEISALHEARARIEDLDNRYERKLEDVAAIEEERSELVAHRSVAESDVDPRLLALDAPAERLLRDKLEEYADEQAKAQRALDTARENSASSSAAYEALLEMDEADAVRERSLSNRRLQLAISILLPLAFIGCGAALFSHGSSIHSLSLTALGIALIVLACSMAAAALVVFLRPNRGAEALKTRRNDAQWVMLQDKKKLDASLKAKTEIDQEISDYAASSGLEGANGSIRQARALLDDAREARAAAATYEQRLASLDMRAEAMRNTCAAARSQREQIARDAGFEPDVTVAVIDAALRERGEARDALTRTLEDMNTHCGELGQHLRAARDDRTFDQVKLELKQLKCRLRESKRELVVLLLAKRMLEKSIAAWEGRNQPEVFTQASLLFGQLTDGAWTRVAMTSDGRLVATASDGEVREVRHLSLGTCQQLYLALRIALLTQATTVGTSIPIIADDILVNFDAARRRAAACALSELARKRQVIVFTCHRETVDALAQAAGDGAAFIEL